MRAAGFVVACLVTAAVAVDIEAQRRGAGRGGAAVTFAISVTDQDGAPVPDVLVTVEGPARRAARTEGGRIAFEGLPAGTYLLRFEREGFVTLERELPARGAAPIDVKVTLKRAPEPPSPPPEPETRPKRSVDAQPAVLDVPAVFERELTGRGARDVVPLACGDTGAATLMQVREPVARHTHDEEDEFLYVIGGEGTAQLAGREERLKAGVLVFVPHGVPHALAASGRRPLVVMSTRGGASCADTR